MRFSLADKRVRSPAKLRVALDRLDKGELPFEVVAYTSWGKASAPIKGVWRRGTEG